MRRSRPADRPSEPRASARVAGVAVLLVALAAVTNPVDAQGGKSDVKLTAQEYEGWRQYNANCARCHGQDALPNPVAANLLESLAASGPMHDKTAFTGVVMNGRLDKGMPSFAKLLDSTKVDAIHAYLVGRAEKRIPPGRPKQPS